MRLFTRLLAALLALACTAQPAFASRDGAANAAWPHGAAVVGSRSEPALRSALARVHARVVRRLPALHAVVVRPAAAAAELAGLPGISYAEPLVPRADPAVARARLVPASYEWQYAAAHVDAVPASVLSAARSITIAVVDTGADLAAPDLAAKAPTAYSVFTRTSNVRDANGHGTFVAALAAGSASNGEGLAGFGGDARLLVVQAGSRDGSFTDVDEATAIVYAVDHGAKVINLSLGGPSTSVTERRAIDYAAGHGALVVAAAGNDHDRGNPLEYPAALLQPAGSNGLGGVGLAVGASTPAGTRASFSNTGSYLSLAAPGQDVFSAVSAASRRSDFPRAQLPGSSAGLYGYASGTSYAAPEVAGAAALVWGANPNLSAAQVAQILKDTASGHGTWSPELGYGVLDAGAAVAKALRR